jgi:hypothetical protein
MYPGEATGLSAISSLVRAMPQHHKYPMRYRPHPLRSPHLASSAASRHCDWPGCGHVGEFRAPRSRDHLTAYYWFCLDHVRQYNAAWNYYEGMSDDEVEADIRGDTIWNRPTWPMGAVAGERIDFSAIRDAFGFFHEAAKEARKAPRTPWEKALEVLDMAPPVTVAAVKARYKELVKRHHPDANGGSKSSEEKFKRINQAYHLIMAELAT